MVQYALSMDIEASDSEKDLMITEAVPNSHLHIDSSINTTRISSTIYKNVRLNECKGLWNARAFFFLILWYVFSGCTLFLNKYILSYMHGDPTVLGSFQMLVTTVCGFIQLYIPCGMYTPVVRSSHPPGFYKHMTFVGCTRFITVLLGLISIDYVAVSFTETIKSSAPIFTVLISWLVLGEETGFYVNLSLIPVMSGLALCSATELSFNFVGFLTALATNFTEWPAELQLYTSLASIIVLIPSTSLLVNLDDFFSTTSSSLYIAFILNGIFFHFQSITAYVLMDYINPVTHSVVNTVKRAFLIWLSIILFGNPMTFLSALGTVIVIAGVTLYNKAQQYDAYQKLTSRENEAMAGQKIRSV